jgi:hypothetical protein
MAALTGFTWRAVRALAHLREAWCVADPRNRAAVEAGIRALLAAHSLRDMPRSCAQVLGAGLEAERARELHQAVGLVAAAGLRP